MRTTISVDDTLLAQAKERAARAGKTLSGLIRDALHAELHRQQPHSPKRFRLITFGGGGVQPGVNLERLGDLLDEEDNLRVSRQLGRPAARRQRDSSRRQRPRVRASA
jgi:hypothetical protein